MLDEKKDNIIDSELFRVISQSNGIIKKISENLPLTLFVLGPSLSGKTTYSNILARFLSTDYIFQNPSETLVLDTGGLLRNYSNSEHGFAPIIRDIVVSKMDNGHLVDLAPKIFVWFKQLNEFLKRTPNGNIIFCGSPRDNEEKRVILQFLISINKYPVAIFFQVEESELKSRLLARNEYREDDSPDILEKKKEVYRIVSEPILNSLSSSKIPIEIVSVKEGESEEEIFKKFITKIKRALYKIR